MDLLSPQAVRIRFDKTIFQLVEPCSSQDANLGQLSVTTARLCVCLVCHLRWEGVLQARTKFLPFSSFFLLPGAILHRAPSTNYSYRYTVISTGTVPLPVRVPLTKPTIPVIEIGKYQ
jgi:hypothetical protein